MAVLSILNYDTLNSSFYPCAAYCKGRMFLRKKEFHRMRSLKEIKKRAAKAAAAAFLLLGALVWYHMHQRQILLRHHLY